MTEMRAVRLSAQLCADVEKRFGRQFGSLEDLLAFVLGELLREDASGADLKEEELVEQRLRELGYL